MIYRPRFNTLRLRLMALVLCSLLPILGLIIANWIAARASASEVARAETQRYGQLVWLALDNELAHVHELLSVLARTLSVAPNPDCSLLLADLLASMRRFHQIGVANRAGDIVCSGLPLDGPVNIRDRLYFTEALESGEFALGEYQVGRVTGLPALNAAMPIGDAPGKAQGVVYVALDLAYFEALFAQTELPERSALLLLQPDGRVLTRFPEPARWAGVYIGESDFYTQLRSASPDGSPALDGLDGVRRIYVQLALATPSPQEIILVVGVPEGAYARQVDIALRQLLVAYSIILGLALLAAHWVAERTILKFFNPLLGGIEELAEGNPRPIRLPVSRIWEFDRLAGAFERLASTLVDEMAGRQQAIHETQQRLAQLAVLRKIDLAILAGGELTETLEIFASEVGSHLGAERTWVVLELEGERWVAGDGLPPAAQELIAGAGRSQEIQRLPRPDGNELLAIPLILHQSSVGALVLSRNDGQDFGREQQEFAWMLAGQAAIAIDNAHLLTALRASHTRVRQAYDETIAGWAAALDLRDQETLGHSTRVTELTLQLADRLGLPADERPHLRRGALLHDVGKLGIPDQILLKPGPLTEAEWAVMKQHPVYAYDWLAQIDYLRPALDIPRYHHERWDGSGYPDGLRGSAIPIAARVFAVVDVWDALIHARPYRPAWPLEQARTYLQANAGVLFDPELVGLFLDLISND